ncbi:MAG TPA: hypothetical protein VGS20_05735 [Candidatus Acidoferrales bacterium]|nr:hypothetical protein [Candidatus Acidoferrales bacterium]
MVPLAPAFPAVSALCRLPATGPAAVFWVPIHFSIPGGGNAIEEIVLRWIHFVAGTIWIGLLYFFNLAATPALGRLEPEMRARITIGLMPRTLAWFRWSALVTVLAGLRYYTILLAQDAHNAGRDGLMWTWLWHWLVVWMAAYVLIHGLMMPVSGPMNRAIVRAPLVGIVAIAASWIILDWNGGADVSNASLAIAVGGGLGLAMLFIVWGFVWRAQKRLLRWTRDQAETGKPLPAEAAKLARRALVGSRVGFWLSLPMLFFMGAAEHFPFLSAGR